MPCRSLCMNRSKFLFMRSFLSSLVGEVAIDQIKKEGQKEHTHVLFFVRNFWKLRAGGTNEPHFAHNRGKSCLMSQAYEQYEKQTRGIVQPFSY
jgi:hypothetical protein